VGTLATNAAQKPSIDPHSCRRSCDVLLLYTGSRMIAMATRRPPTENMQTSWKRLQKVSLGRGGERIHLFLSSNILSPRSLEHEQPWHRKKDKNHVGDDVEDNEDKQLNSCFSAVACENHVQIR
jgi:hypothetical protein